MKKEPSGKDLLSTLVNLLAEQEGVKINFEIEQRSKKDEKQQNEINVG